jgi:putative methyltransferase (TIGR04325 family)
MIAKAASSAVKRKAFNLVTPGRLENSNSSNSPRSSKKQMAKALLDMAPMRKLIDLGKSSPAYRNFLNSYLPSWVKYRGVFNSFEEALATAPKNIPVGFDHAQFAGYYKWLAEAPRAGDYPTMFWLREVLKSGSRVFDFGGNVGVTFFAWQNHIDYPSDIHWMVEDVSSILDAGRAFVKERGETRVQFTDRFEDADGYDILLSCGCLQFVEPTLGTLLSSLQDLPRHIIINRLPLHASNECVTLQNIRWQLSAYHVFQYDHFVSELEALGYTLVDLWSDGDSNCWIPFYPEYSLESFSGLYLRRD